MNIIFQLIVNHLFGDWDQVRHTLKNLKKIKIKITTIKFSAVTTSTTIKFSYLVTDV